MVRLLGASALALALTMPAAHAAHRHVQMRREAYRHHTYRSEHHLAWHHANRRVYASVGPSDWGGGFRDNAHQGDRDKGERLASGQTGFHAGYGPRPGAWCGWYARQLVGRDPGPQYNLARNWAHWGQAASPGVGVMVVWPHHVGMITGRTADGQWIVKSGNDGRGMARERPRSIAGAIAFRAS